MAAFAVIPAYNEEKNIGEVIRHAKKYLPSGQIIVVDDGSRDATHEAARKEGVTVLRHIVNLGKGAALKTGCDYALQMGADAIVAIDSDRQHDPSEIPKFIKLLSSADIVFGYRELNKDMPAVLRFGNWFIERATQILFHIKIRDTQCGYRAFTSEAYRKIRWSERGYSVESEMIALAGKHKLRYSQLPIETIYIDKYKGTTVMDGISIVLKMLWWKITR